MKALVLLATLLLVVLSLKAVEAKNYFPKSSTTSDLQLIGSITDPKKGKNISLKPKTNGVTSLKVQFKPVGLTTSEGTLILRTKGDAGTWKVYVRDYENGWTKIGSVKGSDSFATKKFSLKAIPNTIFDLEEEQVKFRLESPKNHKNKQLIIKEIYLEAKKLNLPKKMKFDVALPNTGSKKYKIELDRWDIPSDGTQPVKTTDNLQAAINWAVDKGYKKIVIPNGHFLVGKYGNDIYQAGIYLPGDKLELELSKRTKLEMDTNDKWNYCIISVTGKKNIYIHGGTLKGDRKTHIFTPRESDGKIAHDEGHAICIQSGTKRVLVEDMTIHSTTGDGLLLVTEIEDVTIRNNEIYDNRRQGVSVVGGIRIAIYNNHIHHIVGTAPQFGVDIEGAGREDRDIMIKNNYFHHNKGGDVVNTSGKNTFIIQNVMHQGTLGERYIDGPLVTWENTDNVIAHNTITMMDRSVNGLLGYIQYSGDNDNNPATTYVHDNVCNGCGMYMYRANNADIRRNKLKGYFLSLAYFENAKLFNNEVFYGPPGSPRYCWNYRIRETTGRAGGNKLEGNDYDIPFSDTPFTSQCLLDLYG